MADRDPKITQSFINEALANGSLSGRTTSEKNRAAWQYLLVMRRQPVQSMDASLADAEHYMYARYLASSTGDPLTNQMVMGYELVKTLRFAMGQEKSMRTDQRFPVLPPSTTSMTWGLKGAGIGLAEYKQEHDGKLGNLGDAIKANQGLASTQYTGAYTQPISDFRSKVY